MGGSDVPIAVIGIGCRFAGGADGPEELWSLLAEGRNGRKQVPRTRWKCESFYHPDASMKEALNWKHGYFLEQSLSEFDCRFFDIPPREAAAIDPQQRLLLETTYEALEQAGITMEGLRGSDTSVHIAMFARDYDRMGYRDGARLPHLHLTGAGDAILAARISYFFNLKGPCNTLDTGCSGSAVAVHQACETLRAGRATMAIAGSSQLLLSPEQSIGLSLTGVANPDGICYVFDDRGKGYGRGEGVATLVLKRLDLALADGDPVQAVILESGINHDGRTKGIFLPNAEAQEALSRSVYSRAELDPRDTLYVEAHGTGTEVGDAAEVQSISRVFGKEAGRASGPLRIGSIKANIGHLEASSGASGIIKAILMLRKNQIPPQLNFVTPKPSLHLDERNIEIPLRLTELAPEGHVGPRRISVNSFGYGGTNAHIIVQGVDHPSRAETCGTAIKRRDSPPEPRLIILMANSETSLKSNISNLQKWLRSPQNSETSMDDLSYTLCKRRSKLPWRFSAVASSLETLADYLDNPKSGMRNIKAKPAGVLKDLGVAFIFTGQGAQWAGMARELLATSPTPHAFRDTITRISHILDTLGCDWDLATELGRDEETSRLGDARISQPATTAVQLALVDLLASWGVHPSVVCGHSSGEIAAAYAAGALDLEAAVRVSYFRGVVSSQVAKLDPTKQRGAMLAVGEGEASVSQRLRAAGLEGRVVVACVNSPESTTVSGEADAVEELARLLTADSIFNRRLRVDAAYHSHHMAVVADAYLSLLQDLQWKQPRHEVAFISSVTPSRKTDEFGASYWVSNLVSQVKFTAAAQLVAAELMDSGRGDQNRSAGTTDSRTFIEIGPHSALEGPLRQTMALVKDFKHAYMPCLIRHENAKQTMLELAGRMLATGWPVQLDSVLLLTRLKGHQFRAINTLPRYAWDHSQLPGNKEMWTESRLSKSYRLRPFPYHDLLGLLDVVSEPLHEPRWRFNVSLQSLPWLADHVVDGFIIFPGAAYLTMVIEAAKQQFSIRTQDRDQNQTHSQKSVSNPGADSTSNGLIKAVHFRNVSFAKSLQVEGQEPDGSYPVTELMLSFSEGRQHPGSSWQHFRVVSYNSTEESWTEHSTGLVCVETLAKYGDKEKDAAGLDEVEGTREEELAQTAAVNTLDRIRTASPVKMTSEQFYSHLEDAGNVFGPTFQGVKSAWLGKGVGTAEIVVPDVAAVMPGNYMEPHTIHPSALDAVTQLQAQLFQQQFTAATVMPVFIAELSISANIDSRPGAEFEVALELEAEGVNDTSTLDTSLQKNTEAKQGEKGSAIGKLWAFQKDTMDGISRPVITASRMRLRAVGEVRSRCKPSGSDPDHVLFDSLTANNSRLEWQQDVDFLGQQDFLDMLTGRDLLGAFQANIVQSDQVATHFVRLALEQIDRMEGGVESLRTGAAFTERPHLHKLLDWMLEWNAADAQTDSSPADKTAALIHEASINNALVQALARIGPKLVDIFTSQADALELLLEDDLLERIYADDLGKSPCTQMAAYLSVLSHKYPGMKVLEVGAGTGGATLPLLERLDCGDGRLLMESYTFTDISSGFFERARQKFARWAHQMAFATLDVSRDPVEQGFVPGSFDLVVASNVLHATPSMDETLNNIRRLLKPGGRLIVIELTRITASINVIFGNLEGWWLSKDERAGAHSPLLTVGQWDTALKRNMFSGTELAVPDQIGDGAFLHLIVSRAVPDGDISSLRGNQNSNINRPMTMDIFFGRLSPEQHVAVEQIRAVLNQAGVTSNSKTLQDSGDSDLWEQQMEQMDHDAASMVIEFPESELMEKPSPAIFDQVRRLLTQTRNLIWVSLSNTQTASPAGAMITGIARAARQEHTGFRFITVHSQKDLFGTSQGAAAQRLAEICMRSFWPTPETLQAEELEYIFQQDQGDPFVEVHIPRLLPDKDFAEYVQGARPEWAILEDTKTHNDVDEEADLVDCRYLDKDRPLQLDVPKPGLLSSMRFTDNNSVDESLKGPLGPDEIQMEARAYGINFKDVLIALGQLPPGNSMASEVCGIITAVGDEVSHLFQVGDRAVGAFAAPFGSQLRASGWGFYKIPDSLSFAEAASIPLVFYTAWYCLCWVARLRKGQTVLIHAASGGVGQAAVQFAQVAGAEIFCTVGSKSKKQLIQDRYGIPDSHIFSSRVQSGNGSSFRRGVLRLTGGRGVDVVLNSLSGDMLMDSWDCVAMFGTFVEIGKTDMLRGSQLSMAPFDRQITFASVDLALLHREKPKDIREGMTEILDLFDRGVLRPVYPLNIYDMSAIHDAFRLMAARRHVGKQIVVAEPDTIVKATRPVPKVRPHVPLQLHRDGTYIVCGGLGDLGRRIIRFLAERGAGHIVTLSRRQLDSKTSKELQEAIRQLGATLHIVQCDMTDEDSVKRASTTLASQGLSPVKGIIQASLVLRDSLLEHMTHDDYMAALGPKVRGTINVDKMFCEPSTTDFFIMLSSMSNIVGLASQSNYGAGNAFQDAFAHIHAQKQPASALQHTRYVSINVGAVQGSEQATQAKGLRSGLHVPFAELLTTLEYAMGPHGRIDGAAQCIMRLDAEPWARLGSTIQGTEGEGDDSHLPNHLFDVLMSLKKSTKRARSGDVNAESGGSNNQREQKKGTVMSPGQAAAQAKSATEAEAIVAQATATKLTAFVGQDVAVDESIAALGLDSLVSIELKNWIVHTFKVRMQASEVTASKSILALSQLIVSRMSLERNKGQPDGRSISSPVVGNGLPNGNSSKTQVESNEATTKDACESPRPGVEHSSLASPAHGLDCCKSSKELPIRPPPDLDDAIRFWIETSEHLFAETPEKWAAILSDIELIRAPNSPARLAFNSLLADYGDGSRFSEELTKANWLGRRELVLAVNTHIDGEVPHTQAERAAVIAQTVVNFKRDMQKGLVKPLWVAGKPVCTWAWRFLFNTVREPRRGGPDETVLYDRAIEADHLLVLRKGRVFKIPVCDSKGVPLPFDQLCAAFDAILDLIPGTDQGGGGGDSADVDDTESVWTGMLTTDDRDSWADMRQKLIDAGNVDYLLAIESAITVINLDTCSPRTAEERARQVHNRNGLNRWFDKPLQFAVGANGTSCVTIEHSRLDGLDLMPLWERIAEAITSYRPASASQSSNLKGLSPLPQEVVLRSTPEIKDHITTLQTRFLQLPPAQRYMPFKQIILPGLGTDFLLASKARIKSTVDVTYLLAVRLLLGRCVAAVTPLGIGHFHRSRVEIGLTVTPAVKAFCDAAATSEAADDNEQKTSLATLLHDATAQLASNDRAHTAGPRPRSHVRIFELLAWLWNRQRQQQHQLDGPQPPPPRFLTENMSRVMLPRDSTPRVNGQTMGFEARLGTENALYFDPALTDPSFWAVLVPERDHVRVSLCAGSEESACAFEKCMHRAAGIVRWILESE